MKKIILILTVIMVLGISSRTQASWYDWFLGVKKDTSVDSEIKDKSNTENKGMSEESKLILGIQKPISEIDSLKAEVATLKTNLDSLYKAHNLLVNTYTSFLSEFDSKYNGLLKNLDDEKVLGLNERVVKLEQKIDATANLTIPNPPRFNISSEQKITDNICEWVFGGFSGCPSFRGGLSIEDRIEDLERNIRNKY